METKIKLVLHLQEHSLPHLSVLTINAIGSSEVLVPIYKTERCCTMEGFDVFIITCSMMYCHRNLNIMRLYNIYKNAHYNVDFNIQKWLKYIILKYNFLLCILSAVWIGSWSHWILTNCNYKLYQYH
jgi:hypothetical protein